MSPGAERDPLVQPDPHDVCVCGDYRRQHLGGTGPCVFNRYNHLGHGMGGACHAFRLFLPASNEGAEIKRAGPR